MTQHLVLTVIGDDRPGLVEALSHVVAEHHGNWSESRMAHLADKFAGIVTVTVPKDNFSIAGLNILWISQNKNLFTGE